MKQYLTSLFYTPEKIKKLNKENNRCVVIIYGKVYDVGHYADYEHPGGENILMQHKGEELDDIMADDPNHQFTPEQVEQIFKAHEKKHGVQCYLGFFVKTPSPASEEGPNHSLLHHLRHNCKQQ